MGFLKRLTRPLLVAAAVSLTAGTTAHAGAETFPGEKPVRLVVPYPAGGASDVIARIVSGPLGGALSQTVVVENIGGATGLIGAKKILTSPPDGYAVLQGSANDIILTPLLNRSAGFLPEDFKLVAPITKSILVLVTRQDLPAASLDEFIELARRSGGQPLSYGSVGVGSQYHLMGEKLGKRVGGHVLHVPYKGAAAVIQDIAGGQLDFAILPYQPSMADLAQQGRMRILTAFSKAADLPPAFRHLPPIDQSRILPDFVYSVGSGLYVRKDVSDAVTQRLRDAMGQALGDPAVRAALEATGRAVMPPLSAEEARAFHAEEIRLYRDMADGFSLPQ